MAESRYNMAESKFQEILIEQIRSVGEDLINHAAEYAGGNRPTMKFKIEINLDSDTDELQVPEIIIHRTYFAEDAFKKKLDMYNS